MGNWKMKFGNLKMVNEITDTVTPNKPNQRQIYPVYVYSKSIADLCIFFCPFA